MTLFCFKRFLVFNEKIKKNVSILLKKSLSAWLGELTSGHDRDFYCLHTAQTYSPEKRLEKHEEECFDHDDCPIEMPHEDNKILEYRYVEKSLKALFMVPSDL